MWVGVLGFFFVGLLLADRSIPVLRLASISGESRICTRSSTFEQHYSRSSSLQEMEEVQPAATKVGDGEGHWMLL